jgi:hypothetical protein
MIRAASASERVLTTDDDDNGTLTENSQYQYNQDVQSCLVT